MIYISTPSAAAVLQIPRTILEPYAGAALTLRSTVGLDTVQVPVRALDASELYFTAQADLSALDASGEYEYRLETGDLLLASGILVVGDLPDVDRDVYEKTIEYEQYD